MCEVFSSMAHRVCSLQPTHTHTHMHARAHTKTYNCLFHVAFDVSIGIYVFTMQASAYLLSLDLYCTLTQASMHTQPHTRTRTHVHTALVKAGTK